MQNSDVIFNDSENISYNNGQALVPGDSENIALNVQNAACVMNTIRRSEGTTSTANSFHPFLRHNVLNLIMDDKMDNREIPWSARPDESLPHNCYYNTSKPSLLPYLQESSGLTGTSINNVQTEMDSFRLLISDEILSAIVDATNAKALASAEGHAIALRALRHNVLNSSSSETEQYSQQQERRDINQQQLINQWYNEYKLFAGKTVRAFMRANRSLSRNQLLQLSRHLKQRSKFRCVDSAEIRALIGFQLLVGCRHGKRTAIKDIFATHKNPILSFPAAAIATSKSRLKEVNKFLSFTTGSRERELKESGVRMAKINDIYEMVKQNFQQSYNPVKDIVVDEMLIGFRGRFSARQYMPNKPDKIGIKQWLLVDRNLYTYNMQVYTGREGVRVDGREKGQAGRVIFDMTEPLRFRGYQLTHDRFFTKLHTALRLLQTRGITTLGTIRSDNKTVPNALRRKDNRDPCTSLYAYYGPATLLSYCPKPNKIVPLLSTRHPCENGTPVNATEAEILHSGNRSQKPRMILDYNSTKGFVDTVDKMVKEYTAQRATRKWHHALWWRIIDIAALNAYVLYTLGQHRGSLNLNDTPANSNVRSQNQVTPSIADNTPSGSIDDRLEASLTATNFPRAASATRNSTISGNSNSNVHSISENSPKVTVKRLQFLLTLSMSLIREHALKRLNDQRVSRLRKEEIRRFFGLESEFSSMNNGNVFDERVATAGNFGVLKKRRRCYFCPKISCKKSRYICAECQCCACKQHAVITYYVQCAQCASSENSPDVYTSNH